MSVVFAIDPGCDNSAFVLWNGHQIMRSGIEQNAAILRLCMHYARNEFVHSIAIEQIASYGMAVGAEVFETVYWSGRFAESWLQQFRSAESVIRVPRLPIKLHHCHSTKANDSTIRQALIDRFGKPGTAKHPGLTYGVSKDIWQALALGVYVADTQPKETSAGATDQQEARA